VETLGFKAGRGLWRLDLQRTLCIKEWVAQVDLRHAAHVSRAQKCCVSGQHQQCPVSRAAITASLVLYSFLSLRLGEQVAQPSKVLFQQLSIVMARSLAAKNGNFWTGHLYYADVLLLTAMVWTQADRQHARDSVALLTSCRSRPFSSPSTPLSSSQFEASSLRKTAERKPFGDQGCCQSSGSAVQTSGIGAVLSHPTHAILGLMGLNFLSVIAQVAINK